MRTDASNRIQDIKRLLYVPLPPESAASQVNATELRAALFHLAINCPSGSSPAVWDEGRSYAWSRAGAEPAAVSFQELHQMIDSISTVNTGPCNGMSAIQAFNVMRFLSRQANVSVVAPFSKLEKAIEQFAGKLTGEVVIPTTLFGVWSGITVTKLHHLLDESIEKAALKEERVSTAGLVYVLDEFYASIVSSL
jgi:hypothetical protein